MPPQIDVAVIPRPYQSAAVDGVLESLREHRSTLVVLPTGTGKTIVFSLLAKYGYDNDRKILILVDSDELVQQSVRRLREDVGLHATVEKGKRRADPWANVVVASVQTLSREERLSRWDPEAFSLVIIDEAHHSVADTYVRIIDYFQTAKIVGVTATPDRRDCKSLRRIFEDVAFEMSMREAIEDGWLVPIRQLFVKVEGLDYSTIRTVAGELNQGDLDAVVRNADVLERMVTPTVHYVGERQTIVFCVSVAHAHACVELLHKAGRTAAAVDGTTPGSQRDDIVHSFLDGRIQFLCNVGVFTEGFDAPETAAIAMMRATKSRGLYTQMGGRGTRPITGIVDGLSTAKLRRHTISESHKSEVMILDFVGNSGTHRLVHAASALDPEADDETIDKAEEMVRENDQLSMLDALDLAKELVEEARRRDGGLEAKHEAVEVDPFMETDAGQTMLMFGLGRIDDPWEREPTKPQVEALARFGIKEGEQANRREASALLDKLVAGAKQKRATVRQMQALIKGGYPRDAVLGMSFDEARTNLDGRPVSEGQARVLSRFKYTPEQLAAMTSAEARAKIDEIKNNGWKRPGDDVRVG